MQPLVRKNYQRWMRVVALLALVACAALLLLYYLNSLSASYTPERLQLMSTCLTGAGVCGAIAVGLLLTKLVVSSRYDPNNPRQLERRIQLGKRRAIPKEELEKIMRPHNPGAQGKA
jgi:hypothetical protein